MILKLKHWQLFIGYLIIMIFYIKPEYFNIGNLSTNEIRMIFGIIGLIFCFSWVLIVGLQLNRIKANPYHFRNGLLIFAILCCIIGYGSMHLDDLISTSLNISDLFPLFIMPLTFFGIFYSFKNVAQSLKSIETGEQAKLKDYIIDAILLFAFPIGIWFIQPRLNYIFIASELKVIGK